MINQNDQKNFVCAKEYESKDEEFPANPTNIVKISKCEQIKDERERQKGGLKYNIENAEIGG